MADTTTRTLDARAFGDAPNDHVLSYRWRVRFADDTSMERSFMERTYGWEVRAIERGNHGGIVSVEPIH